MFKKIANEDLNRLNTKEFKAKTKSNFVLVLDNVRSMNNVGSIFRTADAFLCEKIYLCGITPKPPHRDIQKTALGATESVDWQYAEDTSELVRELIKNKFRIVAVEQTTNATQLNNFCPERNQKYAFVLGNEVQGVQQEVIDLSQECLEIPQFGTKHSLNISVATGIIAWKFYEKNDLTTK